MGISQGICLLQKYSVFIISIGRQAPRLICDANNPAHPVIGIEDPVPQAVLHFLQLTDGVISPGSLSALRCHFRQHSALPVISICHGSAQGVRQSRQPACGVVVVTGGISQLIRH